MNVARTWGGIIIIAGPEPFPDICPLGVIARFFWPWKFISFLFLCLLDVLSI